MYGCRFLQTRLTVCITLRSCPRGHAWDVDEVVDLLRHAGVSGHDGAQGRAYARAMEHDRAGVCAARRCGGCIEEFGSDGGGGAWTGWRCDAVRSRSGSGPETGTEMESGKAAATGMGRDRGRPGEQTNNIEARTNSIIVLIVIPCKSIIYNLVIFIC